MRHFLRCTYNCRSHQIGANTVQVIFTLIEYMVIAYAVRYFENCALLFGNKKTSLPTWVYGLGVCFFFALIRNGYIGNN